MDAELLELQRQFESAQHAKSSVRLSERNVVELVHKLQERGFLDIDLLHTVSGKEYITPDQLRLEMEAEIRISGRASLIDLSDVVGVDLYHIEKQAERIVGEDAGLMLINGEIISQAYWDSMAEEINEKLQECSQIPLAELAAQLQVGSELIVSVLEPRLGTIVKGRLEGGQLYTPAYVSRIGAMVRGAARGITVPTNLSSVWSSLQLLLQEMDSATGVSVESTFFQSLFNGLVKDEEILGSLRAGVHWTPAVFAHAQKESVDSFFSQNSFISYDVLHKLAILQPKQYLQSRYPEGIPLDGIFVHPSMVEMLDAAVEDAIDHGNWIDGLSVLPSYIGSQEASKILSLCPSVQKAVKSSKAVVLGDTCVLSDIYIKGLYDQLEKEMDTLSYTNSYGQARLNELQSVNESRFITLDQYHDQKEVSDKGLGSTNVSEKGSKKKRGKGTGSARTGSSEHDPDYQESFTGKNKKNQRKSKDMDFANVSDSKFSGKKGLDKKEDNSNIPSEEWIGQRIVALAPDLGETGDDPDALVKHLAFHLKPMLVNAWKKRRSTMLNENAEKRRRLLDGLQKQIDEVFLDLQLYEKALDLFDDDPSTSIILHKHLQKTTASIIADKLLLTLDMDNKLKNGIEVGDDQNLEPTPLSSGNRIALAKSLPGSLSVKALAVVEALEGKRVEAFMTALKAMADESGMLLKKLDKKLERTLLHSYRKDLMRQVSSESDPVALLPKVIALLYMQVYNKALQAPGRAIAAALSHLKDKLPDTTYKVLMDYHSATVTLLALQAAATEDGEDCTADRILTKKELLESKMSELKGLVLGAPNA